jgi:hypothetical protein
MDRGAPQHVWVSTDGRWHERHPGLLLEWRERPDGWWALVVWGIGGGNVRGAIRQQWLPADQVRPVEPGRDETPPPTR